MMTKINDNDFCRYLIQAFTDIFRELEIIGGADEPFYQAPQSNSCAILYFRSNYPRSLLHEISHYCLAGPRRRQLDDFGYWYLSCGRSESEQLRFENVEARPQGLEKALCDIVQIPFSPSLDDFSGRPPSKRFLENLDLAYQEMLVYPPATAKHALNGLRRYVTENSWYFLK